MLSLASQVWPLLRLQRSYFALAPAVVPPLLCPRTKQTKRTSGSPTEDLIGNACLVLFKHRLGMSSASVAYSPKACESGRISRSRNKTWAYQRSHYGQTACMTSSVIFRILFVRAVPVAPSRVFITASNVKDGLLSFTSASGCF